MALILFALPWIDIQCSEKSLATQTGIQVVYGGGTSSGGMGGLEQENEVIDSSDSVGASLLVAIALISVVGAVVFASISLFRGGERAEMLSSVLPAFALVLLLLQLMIGFPAKKKMLELMSEDKVETQQVGDEIMVAAVMSNLKVKPTPVFYFELLALGIPTLLLVNGFIDKHKKNYMASLWSVCSRS